MSLNQRLIVLFVPLFWLSCDGPSERTDPKMSTGKQYEIKYAKGFSIEQHNHFTLIELNGAWRGEKSTYRYLLYKEEIPSGYDDAVPIQIPIQSIACMSLTHLAFLDQLGLMDKIVAVSGAHYSSNATLHEAIKSKRVAEIGSEQSINYEVLVQQEPAIVMTYGINDVSEKYINKMKALGLTIVLNAEYMETHPLGKTEWIKFVAAFFDELDKADSIFNTIEEEYQKLVRLTDTITNQPSVFVGMPWKGNWYVAGGQSFQAQLFKDAGARYIWANNDERSSIVKSKEVVFDEALNADYWLNVNSFDNLTSIAAEDPILVNFNAMKQQRVYNNNKRMNTEGGNDYWEKGTVEPHIVLKDLITIFHPDLIEHESKYYKPLE